MNHSFLKKIISAILCFCLLTIPMEVSKTSAATQAEIEKQLQQYEKEKEALNQKLQDLKSDKADEQAYQNTLSDKISLINTQLNNLQSQIISLNSQITQMEAEIEEKEAQIEENWELFKSRLRAIYMTSDTSYLATVLGSESYTDMLMKSETLKRVSEHDSALIAELQAAVDKIEADKAAIVENKASVVSMQSSVNVQLTELDEAYAQSQLAIDHMKHQETEYNQDIAAIEKEKEALMRELDAIVNGNTSSGTVSQGTWVWPVPSSRYITSYFNAVDSVRDYRSHTGIDIAAPKNTPIVAANYGTVIAVINNYTPGVGYGRYTMIDHGSNIYTIYAHCESLAVSVGQQVVPGQIVAYMGTTGNSTGYHLHFGVSIKQNGVNYWQNPLNYVSR